MPTEQITLSTEVDGISIEGYYQFDSKEVQLDPSGSYFGSDFVGKGSGPIIVGGAYDFEVPGGTACALSQQTGTTCDAASLLASRTQNNTVLNTINVGLSEMANNANGITLSQSQFGITTMGSASGDNNLSGDLIDNTVLIAGSAALGISAGSHTAASTQTGAGTEIMYTAGSSEFTASLAREAAKDADGSTQIAGIAALQADQKHIYAEDGGEYGVRLVHT